MSSKYLAFTFGRLNHEGARNRPRHSRSMESIIYETFCYVLRLYTSSGLQNSGFQFALGSEV